MLEPTPAIDARYFQYYLRSQRFVGWVSATTSGDRPRVSFETIAGFAIPLAPLSEQRRIVARIDALFTEISGGEAALAEARKVSPRRDRPNPPPRLRCCRGARRHPSPARRRGPAMLRDSRNRSSRPPSRAGLSRKTPPTNPRAYCWLGSTRRRGPWDDACAWGDNARTGPGRLG